MEGWIKLHRKFLTWEWFSDTNTLSVFIYFLLRANSNPGKWKGNDIKRGQLITGNDQIRRNTGLSAQSVRTAINHLKSTGEITVQVTNKFSVVTICKYASYQGRKSDTNSPDNTQPDSQPTGDQQSTNDKQERSKKVKKDERNKDGEMIFSIPKRLNPTI